MQWPTNQNPCHGKLLIAKARDGIRCFRNHTAVVGVDSLLVVEQTGLKSDRAPLVPRERYRTTCGRSRPSRAEYVVRMCASMITNPSKDEGQFLGGRLSFLIWRRRLSSYRLLQLDMQGVCYAERCVTTKLSYFSRQSPAFLDPVGRSKLRKERKVCTYPYSERAIFSVRIPTAYGAYPTNVAGVPQQGQHGLRRR